MKLIIDKKSYEIINANTFGKKLIGLMGKNNITYGMFFKNISSIHTFFMKENIDVVVLNNDNIIMAIKESMPRNKIYIAKKGKQKTSILELPNHASHNLHINDKLTFIGK